MTFEEACTIAKEDARKYGKAMYLYSYDAGGDGCWLLSATRWDDWLYKATYDDHNEMSALGHQCVGDAPESRKAR